MIKRIDIVKEDKQFIVRVEERGEIIQFKYNNIGDMCNYIEGLKNNLDYDITKLIYGSQNLFTSEIGKITNVFI